MWAARFVNNYDRRRITRIPGNVIQLQSWYETVTAQIEGPPEVALHGREPCRFSVPVCGPGDSSHRCGCRSSGGQLKPLFCKFNSRRAGDRFSREADSNPKQNVSTAGAFWRAPAYPCGGNARRARRTDASRIDMPPGNGSIAPGWSRSTRC